MTLTPADVNELIDDCIDHLCDDNPEYGAGSLAELARIWAKSGLGMQSFMNTRQFIINSSIERLGTQATAFINYKLQVAEHELRKERSQTSGVNNGSIIIN